LIYNPYEFAIDVKITVNDGKSTETIRGDGHTLFSISSGLALPLLEEMNGSNFIAR
jgi:hypothetical protein